MKGLKVFNPVAQRATPYFQPADRPRDLRGVAVGLVWNGKGGGDVALKRIAENLKRDLGYEIRLLDFKDDFPFAPYTIDRVANSCRAVIGSTGD